MKFMKFKVLAELSERLAFAKKNIFQWVDISNIFENVKIASVVCFTNESTTLLDIDNSHVEFIILPTKRIGISIDSKYFLYADKIQIRMLQEHIIYELYSESVYIIKTQNSSIYGKWGILK